MQNSWKAPVLESLFIRAVCLRLATLSKRHFSTGNRKVAYRKIITRTGCNRLLFFLMYKLRRSVCNTVSMLSICITRTTLKTFKSILTYTKNVRQPWLNNENLKEKERKKTLIFVMFTLAWMFCQYNCCFVLFLVSSICNGVTEGVRWMLLHRPREKACHS